MLFYTIFARRTFTVSLNELFENYTGRHTHVYSGRVNRLKYPPCFFQQIRNMCKCDEEFADDIDGVTDDIPDHFAAIYRELFSSVNDEDEIKIIKK